MAQIPPMTVNVRVTAAIGLWDAIKLRVAGPELREKMIDEILLRMSVPAHPEDR